MYYVAFTLLALAMLSSLGGAAWAVRSLWPETASCHSRTGFFLSAAVLLPYGLYDSSLTFFSFLLLIACTAILAAFLAFFSEARTFLARQIRLSAQIVGLILGVCYILATLGLAYTQQGSVAIFLLFSVILLLMAVRPSFSPRATSSRIQSGAHGALSLIERGNLFLTGCLILASCFLLYALISHDFSLVYVASYTDRFLPLFYRITAFWAGQAGSMLFWALSVAICGSLFQLTRAYRHLTPETKLWYWIFYLGILAFFGLILLAWNNPFLLNHAVPRDGNGLNPLLQNPGMIFHPPLLFLGYGGFVIPGCLALAQTISGAADTQEKNWTVVSRPFILSAWSFLTAGIVLGSWWAYMELGWGGYWAWDPVENASLIPWLIATAALHTMIIQTRRGKLHGVNVFLMALTTLSAFFATYLVRSGVVQSVHAFGTGGMGAPFLLFIGLGTLIALWIAFHARISDARELAGIDSREGFLVLTCWGLIALAIIILIATMWPVFTAFWKETIMGLAREVQLDAAGHDHGGAVGLTADFYNRVCMPLFAALIAILSLCPWLGWNGGVRDLRKLLLVVCIFIGSAAALYWFGYRIPVAILGGSAAVATLASVCLLLASTAVRRSRQSISACLVHLGLALIALGIAFSGPYTLEANPVLSVGQTTRIGQFDVMLKNVYEGRGPGYIFLEAELVVSKGGKEIGIASPQRRVYEKWGQMQFAEASTVPSLGDEFYATLMSINQQGQVTLRLSSNPLINWLWIGGAIMCLLPFLSLRGITRKED